MKEPSDPRQLALFPELSKHASITPITSLAEYDRALNNLNKINDLGAFIQLKIQGLEKHYTLDIPDMDIPLDYLKDNFTRAPITFHLFPPEIRSHLKNLSSELISFFTPKNSFPTSFGYFLFHSHFSLWKHYSEKMEKSIKDYLYSELTHGSYQEFLLDHFKQGYEYFNSVMNTITPWQFRKNISLKEIESKRKLLTKTHQAISSLKSTDPDYPFGLIVVKTLHIPLNFQEYISRVRIISIFKSIHLEYLADKSINSIEDIKELIQVI